GAEIATVALARLARSQRARVEEGDAVVLFVIADERDEFVLVDDFGAQDLAIPFAQLARPVGLQNDVRELGRPRPTPDRGIYRHQTTLREARHEIRTFRRSPRSRRPSGRQLRLSRLRQ